MKPLEAVWPRAIHAWLIGLASFALFGWAARRPDFYNFDEGVYAEVAREMALTGRLMTPRCNGVPYFEKPPLVYWLSSASYRLFGYTTWAGRLPIVLLGAIGVMALYWLVTLWQDETAARCASVCLATCFGYFIYARTLMMDVPLSALFIVAMAAFFTAWRRPRRRRPMLAITAVTLGLAVMVKGLLGLALPALATALAAVFSDDLRAFLKTVAGSEWLGMATVFVAVAAPWHLIAEIRHPGAMAHYLVAGQLLRYTHGRDGLDVVPLGLGEYLGAAAAWFLPWIIFLPPALALAVSDVRRGAPDRDLLIAALAWTFTAIGFFSLSPSRLEYYPLPALSGMAILVGYWWSRVALPSAGARNGFAAMLVLATLGWMAALVFTHLSITDRLYAVLNEQYRNATDAARPSFATLMPAIVAELIALTGAGLFGMLSQRRGHKRAAFASVLALALVSSWTVHRGLEIMEPFCSVAPLARTVARLAGPDDAVVVMGPFEDTSPIAFYLRRQVMVVDGMGGDLSLGRRMEPASGRYFLDDAGLRRLWNDRSRRVFLVIENGDPAADPPPPTPVWRLKETPAGALYSNRP